MRRMQGVLLLLEAADVVARHAALARRPLQVEEVCAGPVRRRDGRCTVPAERLQHVVIVFFLALGRVEAD